MKILVESKADKERLINYVGEETAKEFFAMKQRLKSPYNDLYYWMKRPPDELKDYLYKLSNTQTRNEKEEEARGGADLLYSDENWKVYHITTYEASVKYGKNTMWCISGSEIWNDGGNSSFYWDEYIRRGVSFYFYIYKGNEKYAVALYPDKITYEIFNAEDKMISFIPHNAPQINNLPKEIVRVCKEGYFDNGVYIYFGNEVSYKDKEEIVSVKIDDTVEVIKDSAFEGCQNLESIYFNEGLKSIKNNSFSSCHSLKYLEFPNSLENIGKMAFYNCSQLDNVTIGNNVKFIGEEGFSYGENLNRVIFENNNVKLDYSVFEGCDNLTMFVKKDSTADKYAQEYDIPVKYTNTNESYDDNFTYKWMVD